MHVVNRTNNDRILPEKIRFITFYSLGDGDALSSLRFISPISLSGIQIIKGVENGIVYEERARDGQLIVLQRDFPQKYFSYSKIIDIAHQENKPVVLDIDDLLFELPENHPDRINKIFAMSLLPLLQAVMEVDLVTVSTEKLRKYLIQFNKNVCVLPNLIDERIWSFNLPEINKNKDGKIIIGYMGGHSHEPDIKSIEFALLEILKKYQEKIQIHFWGAHPTEKLVEYKNVVFKTEELWSYIEFVNYFQKQKADIFIAPLVDNFFNRCKSPIKFLEYSCLGVPGVYSNVEPYSDIIIPNSNGLLASTTDEWNNLLSNLIEDRDLRLKIAINAQNTVQSDWLLSSKAYLWTEAYGNLITHYSPKKNESNNELRIFRSIASQTYTLLEEFAVRELSLQQNMEKINLINIELENQLFENSKNGSILQEKANELEKKVTDLEKNISSDENELSYIRIQLSNKQSILSEIEGSLGYKTLNFYRKLIEKIFPYNSKRRKFYELVNMGFKMIFFQGIKFFINRISIFFKKNTLNKINKPDTSKFIKSNNDFINKEFVQKETNQYINIYKSYNSSANKKDNLHYVSFEKKQSLFTENTLKLVAFYLPQFHPIPENDEWWGKGFTEWTNVSKAVPQFVNHYQPHLPDELGFYDLRVPEVQERQVELAKNYGIHGFCFHYYWFNGKRLLEKPLDLFVKNPKINFPFCLCWANENWTRRWDGLDSDILIAQHYSEKSDHDFIKDITPYLQNKNYIHINNRPVIIVYRADQLPNPKETVATWKKYGKDVGLGEPYLIAAQTFGFFQDPRSIGFDASVEFPPHFNISNPIREITNSIEILNNEYEGIIYDFQELIDVFDNKRKKISFPLYKTVLPAWDNAPRKPGKGHSYIYSSPERYKLWLQNAIDFTMKKENPEEKIIFINAWNEWGEGAYLEPDRKFGYAYLESTYEVMHSIPINSIKERIIFYGHDAYRAGSQIVLLKLLQWFKKHTQLDIRIILGESGVLFDDYNALYPTIVLDELQKEITGSKFSAELKSFLGENVKLIYANTVVAGRGLHELHGLVDAPVITHIHELEKSIQKFAGPTIFAYTKKYTSHFISVSKQVTQNLVENHLIEPDKISLVNPFISLRNKEIVDEKSKKDFGLEGNRIVFGCGTLDWRKGPDLFLETARIVIQKMNLDCHFYWIGGNSDEVDDYNNIAKNLNLDGFVQFLGEKENPREYFVFSDVFFLSSREDPYPLVCLEAAECNLPIVCFKNAGGIPDFVGTDCGFVVPFEDVNSAAEKIQYLFQDDDFRIQLGENARNNLINHHIDDIACPQILSIIRRVSGIKPKVSIIIPTYNHAGYLEFRLKSIFNQNFRDFELIILNDNSTDGTKKVLQNLDINQDISIVNNNENSGSTFAQWVKGFELTKSELIWIAEDDDYCESNFLETLLPYFNDPDLKLAYTNSHIINDKGEITGDYLDTDYLKSLSDSKWRSDYMVWAEQEINEALGIKNTVLNISSAVFRKPDFDPIFYEKLGKMKLAGDWYFIINLIKGGKIFYSSKKLNYHRRHSKSVIGDMIVERKLEKFFSEIAFVHESIFNLYNLSDLFISHWEMYLRKQWKEFFELKPFNEIESYYPYNQLKTKLQK